MSQVVELLLAVATAAIIGAAGYLIRYLRTRGAAERDRDHKLDRILVAFEGAPADPLAGTPLRVGILERISAIEAQLERNGGATMRDAIARLEVAGAAAKALADADRVRLERIERLMSIHLVTVHDVDPEAVT